jgi:hypothetical protein
VNEGCQLFDGVCPREAYYLCWALYDKNLTEGVCEWTEITKKMRTPLHTLKAYRGSTDKAVLVLKPGSEWWT